VRSCLNEVCASFSALYHACRRLRAQDEIRARRTRKGRVDLPCPVMHRGYDIEEKKAGPVNNAGK
jgi:hypothetical protein